MFVVGAADGALAGERDANRGVGGAAAADDSDAVGVDGVVGGECGVVIVCDVLAVIRA